MIGFPKAYTQRIKMRCTKAQRILSFSVAHLYPWQVAPQQSSRPFPGGTTKLFRELYIYNLS